MSENNPKDWAKFKEEEVQRETEESLLDELIEEENIVPAGLEHPDYQALAEKLTEAEQKAHENWEEKVRVPAELDNVRRRAERDVSNANLYRSKSLAEKILPALDSLEQALQLSEGEGQSPMKEGLELTMKLLVDALDKEHVKRINPVGEVFNPEQHEAMSMVETDEQPANTVVAVFQKGYVLHDRVIRPARVVVAKAKA